MSINIKNIFENPLKIEKLIKEIQEVAEYLWIKGWSEKNAGNISVRLPQEISHSVVNQTSETELEIVMKELTNACFFVTGTGKRMRDIARDPLANGIFIQISSSGNNYHMINLSDNEIRPTSELPSHLSIHQMIANRGTKEIVVMHTHATELIALTQFSGIKNSECLNQIIWGMHPEAMVFIPSGVGFIPYKLPGSQSIAMATKECFKHHDIVLWEKHGVFAIGKNILDTFDNIDIACKSANIWFKCKSAGFEPEGLNSQQLDELHELVKRFNIGC